jgi:hypothetical protein
MGNKSRKLDSFINFTNDNIMTIKFKQQGDGRKSWIIDGNEIITESPTNKYHNEMMQTILTDNNYLSIGEVSMWVNDVEFGAEAQNIIDWWITTCKLVANYVALNPNEETAAEFLATLPTYPL